MNKTFYILAIIVVVLTSCKTKEQVIPIDSYLEKGNAIFILKSDDSTIDTFFIDPNLYSHGKHFYRTKSRDSYHYLIIDDRSYRTDALELWGIDDTEKGDCKLIRRMYLKNN